jgi:eukaryotic-like serine/threonine-protein kinase
MGTPLPEANLPACGPLSASGGEVLAGVYRVDRTLSAKPGETLVVAEHLRQRRICAVRIVDKRSVAHPRASLERLERQYQVGAIARSEHIAKVLELGWLDDHRRFMAMEYLEGQSLERWVEDSGVLPIDVAVDLVLEACAGLADAHAVGIVHLALRPSRLFVASDPQGGITMKILDFGSARLTGSRARVRPPTSDRSAPVGRGGAPYVAPEQIHPLGPADERADIFAIGRLLELLLTGSVRGRIDPASGVPAELAEIILRCQSERPEGRFEDVSKLALALVPFGGEGARESAYRAVIALSGAERPKGSSKRRPRSGVVRVPPTHPEHPGRARAAHPRPMPLITEESITLPLHRTTPSRVRGAAICLGAVAGLAALLLYAFMADSEGGDARAVRVGQTHTTSALASPSPKTPSLDAESIPAAPPARSALAPHPAPASATAAPPSAPAGETPSAPAPWESPAMPATDPFDTRK